ncbi:sodium-coupled monocarboxylate transporter 1-like [Amphiura filiformis]|uniref:sodium-coupled monocarboxylate transporter 1-like n=1 Tax=Amphiura filiformis TaxID=82378 RepID=UPI003B20D90E
MDNSDVYPLGTWDYIVFSVFLAVSAGTGLYHGFAKGGQQTTQSFLLADRSVFSLPVAMTLLASFISPITLLGIPAEIYTYGGLYLDFLFSQCLLYPSIVFIFVPVFYGLKITSAYEYLDQRFDVVIRIIGASIFIFQTSFYIAIVAYSPALAIEAVTNFDLWKTILITGLVCTLYTTLGGMKAVIWTDVIMFCVMFATTLMVIIMGTIKAGGFAYVWEFNHEEDRLDIFYFPKDLTARMSFPSLVIGGWLNSLPLWAVGQTAVQRILSARSMTDAKVSIWLNLPFSVLITFLAAFEGLVIYAFYYGGPIPSVPVVNSTVEPVTSFILEEGRSPPNLTSSDQILIYFISQQFGNIPGYQGLFIACIFAGTLSTVSSGINALTAVMLVDIIKPFRQWRQQKSTHNNTSTSNESKDTLITKCLCKYSFNFVYQWLAGRAVVE